MEGGNDGKKWKEGGKGVRKGRNDEKVGEREKGNDGKKKKGRGGMMERKEGGKEEGNDGKKKKGRKEGGRE